MVGGVRKGRPGEDAAIIGDDLEAGEFPPHFFFNLFHTELKKDFQGMIGFHLSLRKNKTRRLSVHNHPIIWLC